MDFLRRINMSLANLNKVSICMILLLISACSPAEKPFTGVKIGKPYEINGKTYKPESDAFYDKIGEASWYGPGFDGNHTASGEVFDQDDITAAHPTLPLPSLVQVTNLNNNKSIIVRVNDRGPFHSNRIIDLSKRSAELIGLKSVESVRVLFLDDETREYIESIRNSSPKIDMVAYNEAFKEKNSERRSAFNSTNNSISNFAPVQSVAISDLEKTKEPEQEKIRSNLWQPPERFFSNKVASNNKQTSYIDRTNSSENKYIVQAGAFSSQKNATKLVNSLDLVLNHKGLVLVEKIEINNKEWWRVHVGPFMDKNEAEKSLQIVKNNGASDARIRLQ
jgi:rare lipoprotein A